ncbi:MAG: cytidylate kinase-like family protein [Desulfosudis oleivorans]|nr:cytidylate kinase-like family protein [Desulfosudis oleivorans]
MRWRPCPHVGVIVIGKLWVRWKIIVRENDPPIAAPSIYNHIHPRTGRDCTAMAILTISREFRSGGQEIGTAVAERMRYDYVGKERILVRPQGSGGALDRAAQRGRTRTGRRSGTASTGSTRVSWRSWIPTSTIAPWMTASSSWAAAPNFLLEGMPHASEGSAHGAHRTAGREGHAQGRRGPEKRRAAHRKNGQRPGVVHPGEFPPGLVRPDRLRHGLQHGRADLRGDHRTSSATPCRKRRENSPWKRGSCCAAGCLRPGSRPTSQPTPESSVPTLKVFFDGKSIILQGVVRRMRGSAGDRRDRDGLGPGDAGQERTALRDIGAQRYRGWVEGNRRQPIERDKKGVADAALLLSPAPSFRLVSCLKIRLKKSGKKRANWI